MGSFGEKLRREREMRGVTLDEIAESTKIARRHLESLEKDDFDSLPGAVFNKGFVRAYAHFIGIDEDQAVADYSAVSKEAPPPEDQFPLEIHDEPNRELNPRHSRVPLLLALLALVGTLAGYSVYRNKSRSYPADGAEGLAGPAAVGSDQASATVKAAENCASSSPDQNSVSSPHATSSAHVVPVDQSIAAPARAAMTPSIAITVAGHNSAPAKTTPARTFFVIIKAKEDAWISVVADGRRFQGVLKADKQRFVRAGKQIVLKTGNAGGIDVSYNGKPLGAIGNESETRTLLFTPAGQVQQ